ncbi:MAG: hypothetical protein MR266_02705 [Erysipelotrichaceae bacterium]|nr:hypothetical protein [Erysipelotrichaceae bacterium]
METYIKINKFDRYISMLKDIKENEAIAILLENIGYIHGEINLKKLENDIINKRKIRYSVIKTFYDDATNELVKHKINNFKLYVDPKEIFKESKLNLVISYQGDKDSCKEIITPYITKIENFRKVDSLLDNNFYHKLLISFPGVYQPIFMINGDGVSIDDEHSLKEKYLYDKLVNYYLLNKDDILRNIKVFNNEALLPYQTDLSKRKALSIYKRGIK